MTKAEKRAYRRGYWAALNSVLFYLNTLETKVVPKGKIYHDVFEMRPPHESS